MNVPSIMHSQMPRRIDHMPDNVLNKSGEIEPHADSRNNQDASKDK